MNRAPPPRPRSTLTASMPRNPRARAPTMEKPHPAAITSSTACAPTNTSCSMRTPPNSSSSSTTTSTASSPSAPPKKNWSSASPPINGVSTAPSPWKPASTANASAPSLNTTRSVRNSTPSRNVTPKRKAGLCRLRPPRQTKATSSPVPSTRIATASTLSLSCLATKAAPNAPSTAAFASCRSFRPRARLPLPTRQLL